MAWHALSANPVGLIQAPMAGVQGVELALAVSGAGALGSLPCAMLDAVALKTALAQIRAQGANVNINFFCHQVPPVDDAREARWRAALLPYYRELGLDPALVVGSECHWLQGHCRRRAGAGAGARTAVTGVKPARAFPRF